MLGEKIKLLRNVSKLSQVELAQNLEVTKQTVSNWENDNILPSIDMLVRICKYFNVSSDYLLGLDDKVYIEITGLSLEIICHIQQFINDLRSKNM